MGLLGDIKWKNAIDVERTFKKIIDINEIPSDFNEVLSRSLKNRVLRNALKVSNALFYWDEGKEIISQPWTILTVESALKKLDGSFRSKSSSSLSLTIKPNNNLNVKKPTIVRLSNGDLQTGATTPILEEYLSGSEPVVNPWDHTIVNASHLLEKGFVNNQLNKEIRIFRDVCGMDSNLPYFSAKEMTLVRHLINKPMIVEDQMVELMRTFLPFLLQKIKMWGCRVLRPDELNQFVIKSKSSRPKISKKIFRFDSFDKNINLSDSQPQEIVDILPSRIQIPLSRIDFLCCLVASSHIIVLQELLHKMAQFSFPLPLIVPDVISEIGFLFLLPLLKNWTVKWEARKGEIVENHLFHSPYKLILVIRIGENPHCGKSSILNQIMAQKYFFSSNEEPGADRGKPLFLNGTVELTWLTQETADPTLWKSVLEEHYIKSEEIILLANLHGDALDFIDQLNLLKQITTSYIVFIMPEKRPEVIQKKMLALSKVVEDRENIFHVLVDPLFDYEEELTIRTKELVRDSTINKIREVIKSGMEKRKKNLASPEEIKFHMNVKSVEEIETVESHNFVAFLKENTCQYIKKIMKLQKSLKVTMDESIDVWANKRYKMIIKYFFSIFSLNKGARRISLAHLEVEIGRLSSEESKEARLSLLALKEELRRVVNIENENEEVLNDLNKKILVAYNRIDETSLGTEHLFREFGRIYELWLMEPTNPWNKHVSNFPEKYAELLMDGQAIEILDGDIGDINTTWLDAICHSVCKKVPKMRVFVLSILGLQSSGKSTLLNALFACKFAVSVGRCTRGLFMRLLFLDQALRDELKVDAILLIDTEGLGAPEKINDPQAEWKDRQMATFAMSVSNLTLINVLGETLRDLTNILQIVIVTMARLDKVDMTPDILMVQHLSERNSVKAATGIDEFCKAIQAAIDITEKNEVELGIRNCKSLQKLVARVQDGKILKQFRPFKSGATANSAPSEQYHEDICDLYESILSICSSSWGNNVEFHVWHELLGSYWNALASQDFTLRFKNIHEIHEFIRRGDRIARVKETIDGTFRSHRESFKTFMQNEFSNLRTSRVIKERFKHRVFEFIDRILKMIPDECSIKNGDESGDDQHEVYQRCNKCEKAFKAKQELFNGIKGREFEKETENTINWYIEKSRGDINEQLEEYFGNLAVEIEHPEEVEDFVNQIIRGQMSFNDQALDVRNERDKEKLVEKIWGELKRQLSVRRKAPISIRKKILDEFEEIYENCTIDKGILNMRDQAILLERQDAFSLDSHSLMDKLADRFRSRKNRNGRNGLDSKQALILEEQLVLLGKVILKEEKAIQFEAGMIRKLQKKIEGILEEFQNKHGKLNISFKWKAHTFALRTFTDHMEAIQDEIDRKNQPLFTIIKKEAEFKKKIADCIENEATPDSPSSKSRPRRLNKVLKKEACIMVEKLLLAILEKSKKRGNSERKQILHQKWLKNSENVRLRYFSLMAYEVQEGKTDRALKHFDNPKKSILTWFSLEVDVHDIQGKAEETYKEEFNIVKDLVGKTSNYHDIYIMVVGYLANVEGIRFTTDVDFDDMPNDSFQLYRQNIEMLLEYKFEDFMNKIEFRALSADSVVMSRLGCTEYCFWCGAICWAQRGHSSNNDSTRLHYTCHQPRGFVGATKLSTEELDFKPCHDIEDEELMCWGLEGEKQFTWRGTKNHEDFRMWNFEKHAKDEFSELNKWFFLKLNKELAEEYKLKPSSKKDLKNEGFMKFEPKLIRILSSMRQKIL